MNIIVPHSWLKEHLKTNASSLQVKKYLSLCGQSVEKVIKNQDDYLYDIEITTNRPDCLAVYGIARELSAILPRFGIKASLINIPESNVQITKIKNGLTLDVQIEKPSLCPRFTAIIFDQVQIKPSPKVIQERLNKCEIRALNNVVDISNYLMLELNQPMHTFDYDKIGKHKMILRESKKGEKIITLDGVTRELPEGVIIIEDGLRRIIDLCGIMGGKNSEVDENTKRVLLFVQTYDPSKIRQATQKLSFRTEASTRFEKGVESEGVILGIKRAIAFFQKNCQAKTASNLIDIYPKPSRKKTVTLSQAKLNGLMGVEIKLDKARKILESLGFQSTILRLRSGQVNHQQPAIHASVPYWRLNDISIPEDLVEEIARIDGYFNLPNNLPGGNLPNYESDPIFDQVFELKTAFKYWGFTETYNYSMIDKNKLDYFKINPDKCLQLSNPLTTEWVFLRPTLIPSLLEVVAKNIINFSQLKIYEIANTYHPRSKNCLPEEVLRLSFTMTAQSFFQAKGLLENLKENFNLNFEVEPYQNQENYYDSVFTGNQSALIRQNKKLIGFFGFVKPDLLEKFQISSPLIIAEIRLLELLSGEGLKPYRPIPKYPSQIEDLAFIINPQKTVGSIIKTIRSVNPMINAELFDSYQNTRTFRITYQHPDKTLTSIEVSRLREAVIKKIEGQDLAVLKKEGT